MGVGHGRPWWAVVMVASECVRACVRACVCGGCQV